MIERVLNNRNFFANLVLGLMIIGMAADMAFPGARSTRDEMEQSRLVCHLLQIIIVGVMLVFLGWNYTLPRTRAVVFFEVSLLAYIFITVHYAMFSTSRSQLVVLAKMLYWPIGYFFFRIIADDVRNYNRKLICLLISMSIFAVWYYITGMEFRARFAVTVGFVGSNVGWDLLYIFLISLCLVNAGDSRGLFIGAVALALVPLTLKRGAILAELAICLSLLVASQRLGILREFLRKCAKWAVVAVAAWFIVFAGQMGGVTSRFSGLTEDGGSGRSEFYRLLYDRWQEADLPQWLFGFGFWSTPEYLGRVWLNGIYAHSDFLEILHDYGLLGMVVYLMVLMGLLLICWHNWKIYSPGMLISFSVFSFFFVKGLISGNIMFRQTIYLVMPLGYMVGVLESGGGVWSSAEQDVDAPMAYCEPWI